MLNLFYDCYTVLNKVYGEKAFIKQALSDTPVEEKNRSAIVKICYGVLDKDAELSYYIRALTEKSPKLPVRTILKISMYNLKYLGKKDYAVIKNAVELTKKLGKGGASGFVNAFLRKFVTADIALPHDKIRCLSVKYSYPEFAVKELVGAYGEERTEKIISAEHSDTSLVFYGENGEKYLSERKISFNKTPFDNVYTVKNFSRDSGYDEGIYTFQSLGSVAICEAVSPCGKLLDCCAAPGGKSIRLSFKCDEVTSWDIHPHRVALIESYKSRTGRTNVKTQVKDSKIFEEKYEEFFDAVLADVPCSGLGVAGDNPDIKLNKTKEVVDELNTEQYAILSNVCKYVKRGGYLYYSTCSVLPRENNLTVERFLSEHSDFEIVNLESALPHENVGGANVFLPDISGGAGFFVAKMKKL